jgi:hypothetical protein
MTVTDFEEALDGGSGVRKIPRVVRQKKTSPESLFQSKGNRKLFHFIAMNDSKEESENVLADRGVVRNNERLNQIEGLRASEVGIEHPSRNRCRDWVEDCNDGFFNLHVRLSESEQPPNHETAFSETIHRECGEKYVFLLISCGSGAIKSVRENIGRWFGQCRAPLAMAVFFHSSLDRAHQFPLHRHYVLADTHDPIADRPIGVKAEVDDTRVGPPQKVLDLVQPELGEIERAEHGSMAAWLRSDSVACLVQRACRISNLQTAPLLQGGTSETFPEDVHLASRGISTISESEPTPMESKFSAGMLQSSPAKLVIVFCHQACKSVCL